MTNNLETRLRNYILLIILAAMMIGVEFFFEMNRPELKGEICNVVEQHMVNGDYQEKDLSSPGSLSGLRNKIIIMLGLLTIVVAIVMTMFVKMISMPLLKVASVAQSIKEGDLTQYVTIEHDDEIGLVGNAINELSINLQETTTFTSTVMSQTLMHFDEVVAKIAKNENPDEQEIKEIRDGLKAVIDFVDSYTLLHPEDVSELSTKS
jgi:methyl-accepting chemotaxis protein